MQTTYRYEWRGLVAIFLCCIEHAPFMDLAFMWEPQDDGSKCIYSPIVFSL